MNRDSYLKRTPGQTRRFYFRHAFHPSLLDFATAIDRGAKINAKFGRAAGDCSPQKFQKRGL